MLTSDELTQARADVAEMLTDTAYILRPTDADASFYDAHAPTWGTVGTVSVRVDRLTRATGDAIIAEAEQAKTFYQLSAIWNADIRDGDRVSVDSRVYDVLQIQTGQSYKLVVRGVIVIVGEGN